MFSVLVCVRQNPRAEEVELTMNEKNVPRQRKIQKTLIVLAIVFTVLLVLDGSRYYFRMDFSKDKLFSVAPVTQAMLGELTEPMCITYYLSDEMKKLYPQVRDVSDFLYAYAACSDLITVEITDPAKDGLEPSLAALGIMPQQIQSAEKNRMTFSNVYSAVVIEYMGSIEQIPFVLSTASLEFDLDSRFASLVSGNRRAVSIIVGNGDSTDAGYSYVIPWLEASGFACTVIPVGNISTALAAQSVSEPLLVLGSSELSDEAAAAVESFVMKGGRAVFAVSSNDTDIYGTWTVTPRQNDALLPLLERWGITLGSELLLDVSNFRMTMQSDTPEAVYRYINYPFWVVTGPGGVAAGHPVTSGFSGLELFWPVPLYLSSLSDAFVEPLVFSSPASWLVAPSAEKTPPFVTDPFTPYSSAGYENTIGRYPVAAAVEGKVPGLYQGGQSEQTRIVVVSDQ